MSHIPKLTTQETELLRKISLVRQLPLVRLELRSSKEKSLISTALNHVLLINADDTMEEIKNRSQLLTRLAEQKLITLDYNLAVTVKSDYELYYNSGVYSSLCQLVEEGKERPGFLFDTPYIKKGRAVITPFGKRCLWGHC